MRFLLSLLVLSSLVCCGWAAFSFSITAAFTDVIPADANKPYYDLCGFDCRSTDGARSITNYCDIDCRESFLCSQRVAGICISETPFYGPFCYTNGCPGIFNSGSVQSTYQLRWGQPAESTGMSGMGFNANSGTLILQQEFILGQLTHYNFPIFSGTFAKSFTFKVFLNILNDGRPVVSNLEFAYPMGVDETPNNQLQKACRGGTCPYPSALGLDCSTGRPLCPDKISVLNGATTVKFPLNNVQYTLALTGFRVGTQKTTTDFFISDEGQSSSANMYAIVTPACPSCPLAGTKPFFDLKTLLCSCPCDAGVTCPGQTVKQPNCQCKCPVTFCRNGATANADSAGNCKCDCGTATCTAPRVPIPGGDGKCDCSCPNSICQRGGTPNQNSPDCGCSCPACPPNFQNDNRCNCQCALNQGACTAAQNFNSQACSCDCKFSCPKGGRWGAQQPGSCSCPCDTAALSTFCQSQNRQTKFVAFNPATNNADAACGCGDCIPNYSSNSSSDPCVCARKCTDQYQLEPKSCTCFCPPGAPVCKYPLIPNPSTCSCVPCNFPNQCQDACKSTADQCKAQNRELIFNSTTCACGKCINKFVEVNGVCVCNINNADCGAGAQYTVKKDDCTCQCPAGGPTCTYPTLPVPATCSCRPCNTDTECRTLCTPTIQVCQKQNREVQFNNTFCGCGKCINRYDDRNGQDPDCKCRLTTDQCGPAGSKWLTNMNDCTCNCPTFNCSYPGIIDRNSCSCRPCSFPAECQNLCADIGDKCAKLNRKAIFTPTECRCGECINNFTGPADTTQACGTCPLTLDTCVKQYPGSTLANTRVNLNKDKCLCECPAAPSCTDPLVFDSKTCSCQPCPPDRNCTCSISEADCKKLNRERVLNATYCGCGNCVNRFLPPDSTTTSVCGCNLTTSSPKCGEQSVVDLATCTCTCPAGKPNCTYPFIRNPDLSVCGCKKCDFGAKECVCNKENECLAKNRAYIFNDTVCGCGKCVGNFTEPPAGSANDNCVCALKATDAICGGPLSQAVVDTATCTCSCPAGAPKCVYPYIVDPKNFCACKKCDPNTSECPLACTKNCTVLNRELNRTNEVCECGGCINKFVDVSVPKDTNATCVCNLTPEQCGGPGSQFLVDKAKCLCNCPAPLPNCTYPFVQDLPNCNCRRCNFTSGECFCPPDVKDKCVKLNREFVFDANTCGCGKCINNFTDTDTVNKANNCTQCDVTDAQCRKQPRELFEVDKSTCTCKCPTKPQCPGKYDIYEASTCSCRNCNAGECICGNGLVEPGEECDEESECCLNCKWIRDQPCNFNKCGVCKQTNPASNATTCQDNGVQLCPSDDCVSRACSVVQGENAGKKSYSFVCNETNLEGRACGDKNLCLRRCVLGKCQAYDNDTVATQCLKSKGPVVCQDAGDCCSYQCIPATGKCEMNWDHTGQTCDDGLQCTDNDTCIANTNTSNPDAKLVCVGTAKCTTEKLGRPPVDFPCTKYNCSEGNGGKCVEVPVGGNITCPAEGFCGLEGKCSSTGECIRPRKQCLSNNTCLIGRCREAEAKCEYLPDLANGLPCDDGDNCTKDDVCTNGICNGTNVCNGTDSGGPNLAIPLGVTGAVVATGAAAAGFFVYKAMQSANIMDPVSWGEMNTNQFDNNPLYQDQTRFGDNPLYNS